MQLCETVNNVTGNKRYYADGVRVSQDKYEYLQILHKRWANLCARSNFKYTRYYMTVN